VLLLLVVLNTVLLLLYRVADQRERVSVPSLYTELQQRLGPAWASLLYPGWDETAVQGLHAEQNRLSYEYDPVAEYRVQPTRGTYFNVTANGFRLNGPNAPWPPDSSAINVFVLGGSTAFGMGLPDNQTIPAALETVLNERACSAPARVYNFGVPGYASPAERARFEQLLFETMIPDVVVFVDGLEEAVGPVDSRFSGDLTRMMAMENTKDYRERFRLTAGEFLASLPMTRLAESAQSQLRRVPREIGLAPPHDADADNLATARPAEWLANKRAVQAVGHQFGVNTLFVWQAVPFYDYELSDHLLEGQVPAWLRPERSTQAGTALYQWMDERRQDPGVGRNLLWLADIQPARKHNLYLDPVHYTAAFSRDIAGLIADDLSRHGWVACASREDRTSSSHAGMLAPG
jgi:hypothetical protein